MFNITIQASEEKIAEATLTSLRVGARATYNALVVAWAMGQRALQGKMEQPPVKMRREWMQSAYQDVIDLLPQSNPFRDALSKASEWELTQLKD